MIVTRLLKPLVLVMVNLSVIVPALARGAAEEVVVTATRSEKPSLELPYSAHVIQQTDMFQRSPRTLPQALKGIPGVMVQETSPGQGSPFIRGFTGFRNLALIDGVKLNNSVFREGPNQYLGTVDPWSADRIEVISGAAGALYGTDAIGGVINVLTRSPQDNLAQSFYRYASAEHSNVGLLRLDRKFGETAALGLDLAYKNFGDLDGGDEIGRQQGIGYDEYDLAVKSRFELTPQREITALYQRVRQNNVPRTHSTVFAEPFKGTARGTDLQRDTDQLRDLAYLKLRDGTAAGAWDRAEVTLSWQAVDEAEDRIDSRRRRRVQGYELMTLGLTAQFDKATSLGQFTYGAEYYRDDVDSFSNGNAIQGPVADDASYRTLDFYVQDIVPLHARLDLIGGVRYASASADAGRVFDPVTRRQTSLQDDWDVVAGNLRLAFDLTDRTLVYGGVSQGFRAPNLSDLTRLDAARSREFEVPSPGLDPEHFLSSEMGVKLAYTRFTLHGAVFHTLLEDVIVRAPTGRRIGNDFEVVKRNAGDGYIQGIEVSGTFAPHPQWLLFGGFAWQDGEADAFPGSAAVLATEPVSRLLPTEFRWGARWTRPDSRLSMEFNVAHAARQDNLNSADRLDDQRIPPGGTPGYTVADAAARWRANRHLELGFRIDNIADEDYRVHGSGTNMPGRNFILEMAVSH